jgi:hypothetical protein
MCDLPALPPDSALAPDEAVLADGKGSSYTGLRTYENLLRMDDSQQNCVR